MRARMFPDTPATESPRQSNPYARVLEAMESVPVNLTALARDLGATVSTVPLANEISGAIRRRAGGGYEIFVNSRHSPTRQRFTIAHELGHLIHHRHKLGDGTNDTRLYRAAPEAELYNDRIQEREEVEANRFAAGLLMPEDLVAHFHRSIRPNTPEALAPIFGVSKDAMRIRIDSLQRRGKL